MVKKKIKKWHKVTLGITLTLLLGLGTVATALLYHLDSNLKEGSVVLETDYNFDEEQKLIAQERRNESLFTPYVGEFTMLIVGSDERDGSVNERNSGVLNDVNLLIHVTEDQSRVSVISIPRDLMVSFPSCTRADGSKTSPSSSRQINASLSTGGLPCVVKVVEELTGMVIPHAAVVNFNSVIQISKTIGGVPVCMPQELRHHLSNRLIAPEGDSIIQGIAALDFVRERKSIQGGGDAGRIHNQQVFIKNTLLKVTNDGILVNPFTIVELMNNVLDNLTVSSTLADVNKLTSLALMVRNVGAENIDFYSLPVKGHPEQRYRLALKPKQFEELMALIKTPKLPEPEIVYGVEVVDTAPTENQPPKKYEEKLTKNADGYYCGLGSGW